MSEDRLGYLKVSRNCGHIPLARVSRNCGHSPLADEGMCLNISLTIDGRTIGVRLSPDQIRPRERHAFDLADLPAVCEVDHHA